MVSRLCDDGVQGRDGGCVENSSCFYFFLFVPVCILLLGSPAGLIYKTHATHIEVDMMRMSIMTRRPVREGFTQLFAL